MDAPRINPPELFTRAHKRVPSLSPTRSPTRQRITDDILSDLSPPTTLEAFTNPSGKLRASIEAASPSERAFGIRATLASKKIQEWVDELSAWRWPNGAGSAGFEAPAAKRRRISAHERTPRAGHQDVGTGEEEYIGSLPAEYVARYENRVDDIHEDMDDLNVEEIKSTVLNTHFSPKSRPSSSGSSAPVPSLVSSFTRMDDLTAVVTATVLQALPNLSRLTRLMDIWTVRLLVLRKVSPLLLALDEAEVELNSGWQTIESPGRNRNGVSDEGRDGVLERKSFETMRDSLRDKVTRLGQDLDYMLDTLEGRQDTLPEIWLDRMETIEKDYGEWVVMADRKVREGEWIKTAKARKAEADRLRAEEEKREAARLQAETEQREREEKLQLEREEADRLERERQETEEKLRLEQEAAAEAARQAELARKQEEDQIKAEQEAARLEAERQRMEHEKRRRLEEEETARLEAEKQRMEHEKRRRLEEEETARLEAEKQRMEHEKRIRLEEEEAVRLEADRKRTEHEERMGLAKVAAENERQAELARKQVEEDAMKLKEQQAADAEVARDQRDWASGGKQPELEMNEERTLNTAQLARQQKLKDSDEAVSKERDEPAPHSLAQAGESKILSPSMASPLPLEIGAAVTTMVSRAQNWEDSGLEALQQEDSHASKSTSIRHEESPTISRSPDLVDEGSARNKPGEPRGTASSTPSGPFARVPPFDGSDVSKKEEFNFSTAPPSTADPHVQIREKSQIVSVISSPPKSPNPRRPKTPTTPSYTEKPSSIRTPSTTSGPVPPVAITSPSFRSTDDTSRKGKGSPTSPSKIARFGHGVANILRRTSSAKVSSSVQPHSSGSQPRPFNPAPPVETPKTPTMVAMPESVHSTQARFSPTNNTTPLPLQAPAPERNGQEWIVAESVDDDDQSPKTYVGRTGLSVGDGSNFKIHNKNISRISGYSTSDPTPEILEAEPAEYFQPKLSPVKSPWFSSETSQPTSPPYSPLFLSGDGNVEENLSEQSGNKTTQKSSARGTEEYVDSTMDPETHESSSLQISDSDVGSDGAQGSIQRISEEFELEEVTPPALARKTSIARINSPIRRIDIPRRESTASDTSTIMHQHQSDATSSPLSPSSPLSEERVVDTFPEVDEESPLKGRAKARIEPRKDRSSSGSLPPIPTTSPRRPFHLPNSPSFIKTEHEGQGIPSTPNEAPVLHTIDLPEVSIWPSPKKSTSTDDQIQAQISSLLESIPARIRLTSEPDNATFVPSETLRPVKARRSITPSVRSHSSLSTRAPTPSFTLAPAYGKGTSRPRPQNGNPEIKLYHLSRSTGEAPIKLFVRLVGENGERVMVRVGGGWADLGEYLREYASHHGRRSAIDSDKVEVQDIRPRVVSNSSTASTAIVRGNNGRSSPVSRPGSAFDRPMSALHIRKTRRSVGETDSSSVTIRNPSTPLGTNRGRDFETPPSETSRSVSRLSWTEEEGGLGLAGPKAKKVAISDRDQEWVESMKEKVRLASAEKEKKEKAKERKSFGEMDRIGGTKRLFRKG